MNDMGRQRRVAKRQPLKLTTSVRHGPFQQAELVIEDLSFTGFSGECNAALTPGTFVSVALPPIGLVRAQVVRVKGNRVAGEFVKAVDIRKCFAGITPSD